MMGLGAALKSVFFCVCVCEAIVSFKRALEVLSMGRD